MDERVGRIRLIRARPADSLAWMRGDALLRLLPFGLAVGLVQLAWRPRWLGLSPGLAGAQVAFGLGMGSLMFVLAALLQVALSRRRGSLVVPSGPGDAGLQAGYYALNGPLEEAFFRGLLQGGLGSFLGAPVGLLLGGAAYVLYHRLGRWSWPDTLATTLAAVPFGLAFWLLPGPPSLLGVSIAHVFATCGFLGPGSYVLHRLGRLPAAVD